jgi:hypothetical protein
VRVELDNWGRKMVHDAFNHDIYVNDYVLSYSTSEELKGLRQGYVYKVTDIKHAENSVLVYSPYTEENGQNQYLIVHGSHLIKIMNLGTLLGSTEDVADKIIKLINSRPRSPTKQEICSVL